MMTIAPDRNLTKGWQQGMMQGLRMSVAAIML
jgi:hypothetical protein